jgi:hypothetical protein
MVPPRPLHTFSQKEWRVPFANETLAELHCRMPLIINEAAMAKLTCHSRQPDDVMNHVMYNCPFMEIFVPVMTSHTLLRRSSTCTQCRPNEVTAELQ